MLIGVGATLSNLVAGWIVQLAGYSAGFLFLSAVAIVGAAIFGFLMPETAPSLRSAATAIPSGDNDKGTIVPSAAE